MKKSIEFKFAILDFSGEVVGYLWEKTSDAVCKFLDSSSFTYADVKCTCCNRLVMK